MKKIKNPNLETGNGFQKFENSKFVSCFVIRASNFRRERRSGAALILALWILLIVSLIVGTFAFEMQLETRLIAAARKQFKAEQLALAGIEMAKAMLSFEEEEKPPQGEIIIYDDPMLNAAVQVANGVSVKYTEALGDGEVILHIDFEESRRNIKKMSPDDWKMMFEMAGIPNTRWDEMIDCLEDWQDENELHRLNGAESDDPFYRERGYECKNAPVDMVDELLLIKHWSEEVLYGTPADEKTETPIIGIGKFLTTWGDGKVNPNSAVRDVLYTMEINEEMIEAILELRLGPDGEADTEDDGLGQADFDAIGLDPAKFTMKPEYVSITSVGKVADVEKSISCIFKLGEKELAPLFWLEGKKN
ncbi:MAG: hypothetical protein WC959_09600 [Kiritimatiellales bacterium]